MLSENELYWKLLGDGTMSKKIRGSIFLNFKSFAPVLQEPIL